MKAIEWLLEKLARAQYRFPAIILIIFTIFSIIMGLGLPKVHLESDFDVLMPQDIPIAQLNQRIDDTFGGQDTVFVLLQLDDTLETDSSIKDIRDPLIMQYVMLLENRIKEQSMVENVASVSPAFKDMLPWQWTPDFVRFKLDQYAATSSFISEDLKKTILIVTADIGGGDKGVQNLNELVEEELKAISKPPGVDIIITGTPQIQATVIQLLKRDSVYTLLIASGIIIILLWILQRSFKRALVIYTPILLSILWTLGAMGHFGISLSIVTAGLGAMILGLGVEYGVFILTRYREERHKGANQEQALRASVPGVGSAILGSGSTTIIGFLALTLSVLPMLALLGLSLAIGIFFSIIAAVVVEPVIIIYKERLEHYFAKRQKLALKQKEKEMREMPL
ncbi:MMPL family transporter [Candidatus Woesearchaeota archaeon]|nr:MMPL family transporter [Candidatus Woesearchaeota archaeon]